MNVWVLGLGPIEAILLLVLLVVGLILGVALALILTNNDRRR